jgi:hypothetical protein
MNKKYNIIYNSHYPWSDIMSRYTNLAITLSKSKHVNKLVFLEPLKRIGDITTFGKAIRNLPRLGRYREIKKSPFSINTAISPVPFVSKFRFAHTFEKLWEDFTIKRLVNLIPPENRILLVQGATDFRLRLIKQFKKEGYPTIFDWGNLYEKDAAPKIVQNKIAFLCREMASEADIVLAVSPRIAKIALSFNKSTFTFPDAVYKDLIVQKAFSPRSREARLENAVVCYYGLINPLKLSYDIINRVAQKKPKWKFIFIGPQNDPTNFGQKIEGENTEVLPPMDGWSLHDFLRENVDLCFIPYTLGDEVARACSPLKLYESFGHGMPIVSTDTFDPGDARKLLSFGSSISELVSAMEYELETDCLEKRKERIEYAKKHTWEKRVEELINIFSSVTV